MSTTFATCVLAIALEIAGLLVAMRAEPSGLQLLYFLLAHLLACLGLCHCLPAALGERCAAHARAVARPGAAGKTTPARDHGLGAVVHPGGAQNAGAAPQGKPAFGRRGNKLIDVLRTVRAGTPALRVGRFADGSATASAAGSAAAPDTDPMPSAFGLGLLVFVVCFSIPGLGILGILFALLPALMYPLRQTAATDWLRAARIDCAELTASGLARRGRGQDSLKGILEHSGDPQRRLQALVATLGLDDHRAVPLLRIALRDVDDEVRLLSYALITRKEKALEENVHASTMELESATPANRLRYQRALAHHFWELGNLAGDGDSARQFYERSLLQAQQCAAAQCGDGALQFLLGRILLRLEQGAAAAAAFTRAAEAGIDSARIRPFLAELAFLQQRFGAIAGLLRPAADLAARAPLLSQHAYWTEVRS